jgi:hypothetical protein
LSYSVTTVQALSNHHYISLLADQDSSSLTVAQLAATHEMRVKAGSFFCAGVSRCVSRF